QAERAVVGHRPDRRVLAAEAHPRPAPVELGRTLHPPSGLLPRAQEGRGLAAADEIRSGGARAREPGRDVALVGVAVDVDHVLARRYTPRTPYGPLDALRRRAVVILVVVGELELVDGAVVRERRPHPDRDAAAADELVDAEHVHDGIDRV